MSRAEASMIVNADRQFNVPKDGSPLRGLIQDHCIGGAFLTARSTMLSKHEYQTLVRTWRRYILGA